MPIRAATLCLALLSAPASAQSLAGDLAVEPQFEAFAAALREAGLEDGGAARTVFAPTNEAFERLPEGLLERLGAAGAEDALRAVVALHLVPSGPHESDDLPVEMTTLAEDLRLVVTFTRGVLTLRPSPQDGVRDPDATLAARAATEARVREADLAAGGRLVHGVDMVLLPPDLDARLAAAEAGSAAVAVSGADTAVVADGVVRPEDFADQVASSDDGATVAVVPDDDAVSVVPDEAVEPEAGRADRVDVDPTAPERDSDAVAVEIVPLEADRPAPASRDAVPAEAAGDVDVFVYDPSEAPVPETEPAEPQTRPGRIVTLPPEPTEPPEIEVEPVEAAPRAAAVEAPAPEPEGEEIELAASTISVAGLLGQTVRDGSGAELGEVADVLIALSDGTVETLVYENAGFLSLDAIGIGEAERTRVAIERVSIDPLDGSVILRGDGDDGG